MTDPELTPTEILTGLRELAPVTVYAYDEKLVTAAADRIEELEADILAVALELLPAMENGQNLMDGYKLLRDLAETIPKERHD